MRKSHIIFLIIGIMLLTLNGSIFASLLNSSWFTLETEHFFIYFMDGYEELAIRVAGSAERIHSQVTSQLGHEPKEKTHVVLTDYTDSIGGMAVSNFYNQIILNTVPPVGYAHVFGESGSMIDWLDLLFTHEYTHIVHLDKASGIFGALRRIFGHVPGFSTPNVTQSLAIIEGLAVYNETLLASGRGNSSFWDMFLRAATLDEILLSRDQILGYYDMGRWDPAGAPYLYGYSWISYLSALKGDSAARKLVEFSSRSVGGPEVGFKQIAEMSLSGLDREWRESLAKRYAAQKRDIVARGITPIEPMETQGWVAVRPRYSPDGSLLAYETSGGTVGRSIRVIDLLSGNERIVTEGAEGGFSWTHDGKYVVYSALVPGEEGVRSDLFAVCIETLKAQRLTYGMRAKAPSVSPSGDRLAFIQVDGKRSTTHILVAPLERKHNRLEIGEVEVWLEGDEASFACAVDWEPVERCLAVQCSHEQGTTGIYLLKHGLLLPLLVEDACVGSPVFTQDGRYILMESDHSGVSNIYAYDVHNQQLHQITNVVNGVFFPAVSPDNSSIAVSYYTSDGYKIGILPFDPESWRVPDACFAGEYWERLLAEERSEKEFAETNTPVVGKYTPASTLVPTWWLPFADNSSQETVIGVVTAMNDALQQHRYSLMTQYGLVTGKSGFQLTTEWIENPWLQTGWNVGLSISHSDLSNISQSLRSIDLDLAYTLNTGSNSTTPVLHRFYGGIRGESSRSVSTEMMCGYSFSSATGAGRIRRIRGLDFAVRLPLVGDRGAIFATRWNEQMLWRQGGKIGFNLSFGLALTNKQLALTGGTGTFAIRGLGPGEVSSQESNVVVRSSLEGEVPLVRIYRGIHYYPIFFERLSLASFIDTGFVKGLSLPVCSVGNTLHLDVTLGYGAMPLAPWIGFAYVFGGDPARSPLRFICGLQF